MVLIHLKLKAQHPRMLCCKFASEKMIFKVVQYILTIISPWKRARPLIWTNITSHQQRMLCDKLVEFGSVVLKKIIKVRRCIFAISVLSPLGKGRGGGRSFEQTWIRITQGCIVSCLVEIGYVVLKKKNFKVCELSLFPYYLPLEKGGALIWTNLNPHHPRILCAKFS